MYYLSPAEIKGTKFISAYNLLAQQRPLFGNEGILNVRLLGADPGFFLGGGCTSKE